MNDVEREAHDHRRSTEIKEALWVVAMSGIGILFLILLYLSGRIMARYAESGDSAIPASFWIVTACLIVLCANVFVLVRDSELDFKIAAIVLTGVIPMVAVLFLVVNLVRL